MTEGCLAALLFFNLYKIEYCLNSTKQFLVAQKVTLLSVTSRVQPPSISHLFSSFLKLTSEMGSRITNRSGSERFTERSGAENSQGCSAPLRIGATCSDPTDQWPSNRSALRSVILDNLYMCMRCFVVRSSIRLKDAAPQPSKKKKKKKKTTWPATNNMVFFVHSWGFPRLVSVF
jgi:hypothetical protein